MHPDPQILILNPKPYTLSGMGRLLRQTASWGVDAFLRPWGAHDFQVSALCVCMYIIFIYIIYIYTHTHTHT